MRLKKWIEKQAERANESFRKNCAQQANERFNVTTRNGVHYITFNGVVVSRADDNDLLARLDEYREVYYAQLLERR